PRRPAVGCERSEELHAERRHVSGCLEESLSSAVLHPAHVDLALVALERAPTGGALDTVVDAHLDPRMLDQGVELHIVEEPRRKMPAKPRPAAGAQEHVLVV